jgi:hypothetical protein
MVDPRLGLVVDATRVVTMGSNFQAGAAQKARQQSHGFFLAGVLRRRGHYCGSCIEHIPASRVSGLRLSQ